MKTICFLLTLVMLLCLLGCEYPPAWTVRPTSAVAIPAPVTTAAAQSLPPATTAGTPLPPTTAPTTAIPPTTVPATTVPATTVPAPHIHCHALHSETPSACTAPGERIYLCPCGDGYTEKIPAQGHTWGQWHTVKEPTYTEQGLQSRSCDRCGAVESDPIPCPVKELTNDDWQQIARLTRQYINEIRSAQGACSAVEMPRCIQYAKLRSQQMADKEKVEHNYWDGIAAATQLQYGRYIDPSLYGLEGEPYYQVYGSEAVGNGYGDTAEEVARCLAEGVSKSPQHWRYVGTDRYCYMSIGVTLSNGWWYCCIITSPVDLDENPLGF